MREENIIWNLIESSLYENIIKKWPLILFWYAKKWIQISSKLLFEFSPHFYLKTSLSVSYINDAWLWLFSCHEEIMRGVVKCKYILCLIFLEINFLVYINEDPISNNMVSSVHYKGLFVIYFLSCLFFQSSNSNSNGPTSGNLCLVEICPASPNICQLR